MLFQIQVDTLEGLVEDGELLQDCETYCDTLSSLYGCQLDEVVQLDGMGGMGGASGSWVIGTMCDIDRASPCDD